MPTDEDRERVDALLGERTVEYLRTTGGYTPAARWRVRTASGGRAFVKRATNDHTIEALRKEHAVLSRLQADFAPRLVGFDDDPEHPILAIEDLGDARWPPPWDDALVEKTRDAIARMHATTLDLPPFLEDHGDWSGGWQEVARDPAPFLGIGLASAAWLEAALPTLVESEARAETRGTAVTHFDIRSDNLCLTDRGVVLIDWNLACRGDPALDLGFWLPSLEMEGGPAPEALLPGRPEIAAWVSGFFAARAGLPLIPSAPRVREVQLAQLRTALPWAVRALGLAAPS